MGDLGIGNKPLSERSGVSLALGIAVQHSLQMRYRGEHKFKVNSIIALAVKDDDFTPVSIEDLTQEQVMTQVKTGSSLMSFVCTVITDNQERTSVEKLDLSDIFPSLYGKNVSVVFTSSRLVV